MNGRRPRRGRYRRVWCPTPLRAAQTEPIVATLELFGAWCDEDSEAIRGLLLPGTAVQVTPTPETSLQLAAPLPANRTVANAAGYDDADPGPACRSGREGYPWTVTARHSTRFGPRRASANGS